MYDIICSAIIAKLGATASESLRYAETDISIGSDRLPELVSYVDLTGGISTNLTDEFVRTTIGRRGRE